MSNKIKEKETKENEPIEVEEKNNNKNKEISKKEKEEQEVNANGAIKSKKAKYIILISLFFILAIFSTIFAIININNTKILSGIKINNIDVHGLSKEEAIIILQKKMNETKEIIINVQGTDYSIIKENLNIEYNFPKAIEQAYEQGRNGNIFENNFNIVKNIILGKNIQIEININEQSLQNEVNKINAQIPNGLKESSYSIENNNLIIKKGTQGQSIQIEEIANKIKANILNNKNEKIILSTIFQNPKEINLEKIREEIYVEPKNAYYEQNPFTVYSHVEGIDFDLTEAKKILQEDKEEYIIPLIIIMPEITTEQIGTEAFPSLLGRCTTKYDESNVSRSTNLKVATKTLNGMIIGAGETFSYNKALGERTYAKGYRLGGGFVGGRTVDMIGGGICQISSTLYNAAIYANLEIVERHNHAHIAAYLDPGKDATVSYGTLDFKFKNTRQNPIMIKASAKNGITTIELYGIKEATEYEIEIISIVSNYIGYKTIYEDDPTKEVGYEKVTQKGMRGCNSTTYKIYKLNGVEVSRELLSKDYFAPMHQYITRGTKNSIVETPIEPETPTTPVEPILPEEPETPQMPEEPIEPEIPENPEEPEEPTIPTEPEPEIPEEPETPINS